MSYETDDFYCFNFECGDEFDPNQSNAKDPLMFCCLACEKKHDVSLGKHYEDIQKDDR